uniref:Dof-type domain-containing protein n=1 Tax=Zea mays TaxID=4577 RepID=B6SVL9_MAIZE|nr:hypothetical protein [Zea mays]|eukprot:NP_001143091.1 uncharacterized LOC100275567 [Zea mays]
MVAECHGGGAAAAGGDFLIKLFGMTIPVPECGDAKDIQQSKSNRWTEQDQDSHGLETAPAPAHTDTDTDTSDPSPQPEVVDAEDPTETQQRPGNGDGEGDAAGQREKLKKPDKVLPCPRCNSMDTKFCYFNNYNVNQPRHFCKNCQRYWTAGGAMRNVPVGAGRRKNKNAAASHFFQRVRATNATVLSFGGHGGAPPAARLDLDLAEQLSHQLAPVRSAGDAGRPCSEGSSSRDGNGSRSSVDEAAANADDGSVQQHPGPASMNSSGATVWPPYSCAPAPAAYFPQGIAIPIYPAAPAYWGCMVPGAWSLPWPVQHPSSSSSPSPTTTSAPSVVSSSGAADDSSSHALGKRPRDREGDDGRNGGNAKVWAPKSIRIDDVDEVARSSIWSLVGIKGDQTKQQDAADDHAGGHSKQLGTVFEPKRGEATKKAMMTSSPLLHANPVALTRSVAFQEGS